MCTGTETKCRPGVGTFFVGPVSPANAMDMAILTGDFSPLKMLPRVVDSKWHSSAQLHSAWISGLVGIALQRACGGHDPLEVEIRYLAAGQQGEEIIFTSWVEENPEMPARTVIVFEVSTGRHGLVAKGRASVLR
jgi:hypothetical protein